MLKNKMKLFAVMFTLTLIIVMTGCQEKEAKTDKNLCIENLIACYAKEGTTGSEEMESIFTEIEAEDKELAKAWRNIIEYWDYTNHEMVVNTKDVPEGLPSDDSMAIVIFGHVLNDDGTMQDELIGRLNLGLALAEKYPNAFVVTTGGGTAKKNKEVTEGGLMAEWMIEQGIEASRVIPEEKAPNTVGNAENVYKILKEKHPQVKSWVVVSSDHHVPRCAVLSYTKCQLAAYESGEEPVQIIANMGYASDYDGYENMDLTATGVADVAKVEYED